MKKVGKAVLIPIVAICLIILVLGASENPESRYTIDTPYEYPILPGTQEWIALEDVIARRKVCQIPNNILQNMTTDALMQTVLDYPFLNNIYAYNTLEEGYEAVKRQFNGLQELESRLNYLDVLTNYCLKSYSLEENEKSLKDYLAEKMYLVVSSKLGTTNPLSDPCQVKTILTPKQNSIPVVVGRTYGVKSGFLGWYVFTEEEMRESLETDKSNFPNATLIRGASYQNFPAYNCFSYALYSQSVSNNYWIDYVPGYANGVWTYFIDGSYDLVVRDPPQYAGDNLIGSRGTAQIGDIMVYGYNESLPKVGPSHVGIINSLKYQTGVDTVVSKWGAGGVWLHHWYDCPYTEETGKAYSIWRLAE